MSPYVAAVREARARIVTAALVKHEGNRVRAAHDLGIAHPNLQRLIRELGVDVPPTHEFRNGWPRGKKRAIAQAVRRAVAR